MKMAFFMNKQTPDIEVVGKILSELSYTVINSSAADEVDQAGLQAGKIVLVFDDAKFAYKFCGENPSKADYQTLRILFLGRSYFARMWRIIQCVTNSSSVAFVFTAATI